MLLHVKFNLQSSVLVTIFFMDIVISFITITALSREELDVHVDCVLDISTCFYWPLCF